MLFDFLHDALPIFTDDVAELLELEVRTRVEAGLSDNGSDENEDGPWKLIAWLEQVQPPFMTGERLFPSFGLSLLLKELSQGLANASADDWQQAFALQIKDLIARAIDAENAHHLQAIDTLLDTTEHIHGSKILAISATLDAFIEG